jgi:hexosaminidase
MNLKMSTIRLIPSVVRCDEREGSFRLSPGTPIVAATAEAEPSARLLSAYLGSGGSAGVPAQEPAGQVRGPFPVERGRLGTGTVTLETEGPVRYDQAGFSDETYTISVSPLGCRLSGKNAEGLARAVQTFRQLLPAETLGAGVSGTVEVPACEIEDTPRLRWRGAHLDVSRHFFPVQDVLKFIDLLAFHRLNRFHFHLTDDQGWRIEIRKYPKLTEIGSRRDETLIGHHNHRPHKFDGIPYGGFYTKDELRRIVSFAADRGVTIVPEIDMPGHMQAAVTAYPEWGVTGRAPGVRGTWDISQEILNVEESTVAAMQDIITEVMELFPGRFIHVGGDEVPKYQWRESKRVQARMAELGIRSEEELQSWFMRRMDAFITENGRRTIGWDEILEGGLAGNSAVMSWRGEQGGVAAAKLGHDVVMAPSDLTYFNYYQDLPVEEEPLAIGGFVPVSMVYAWEPVPGELSAEEARYVLGAQCQHWTEYITTREQLEYMAFPRVAAFAEVLWTARERKNYVSFLERLSEHRKRLAALGVKAHPRP